MLVCVLLSAAMPWRGLRVGPLRLTPYSLCAVLGLVVSMALARRCARQAGLDPETAWDAGLFAILSCFLASRLLLVLGSPLAFAHYPLLLLGLPSLTLGGLATAAAMTWAYLRYKRVVLFPMLAAFVAPCAVLAAWLELGHWIEGSDTGMPTTLPWGVAVPGGPAGLRVHPVALYGVLLAAVLAFALWRVSTMSPHRGQPGRTLALGLVGGGLTAFVLDMLSVPPAVPITPWLEPGQWVALLAMLVGVPLWVFGGAEEQADTTSRRMEVHRCRLKT